MKITCACGKALELHGLPSDVNTTEHPVVIGAARAMGWRHAQPRIFVCATCADEPTETEPAPPMPLTPAEGALQAAQRIEHALDRLALRGILFDDELADARTALSAIYTFAQAEVERCSV